MGLFTGGIQAVEALQRDEDLHELRLRTKKLRHPLELLKPLLAANVAELPIDLSWTPQDILGSLGDQAVPADSMCSTFFCAISHNRRQIHPIPSEPYQLVFLCSP